MKKASCAAKALIAVLLMWTFALIEVLAQSGPPALPAPAPGRLLDVWRFETNLNSLLGDTPIFSTNVSFTPDWDGNGLLIDSTNAASLKYAVVTSTGRTNIDLTNGSFEFWFSPDWNSTDGIGNWGTLLEVGTWDTNTTASGAWGLYVSPDGGGIYFSAQTNTVVTNYLNAPIAWNQGEWHSVVVTYSATNSSIFLEGQLVTNGPGISVVPGAAVVSNSFALGSDGNGTGLLQARGVFNNLITYDYELDADTISNDYNIDSQFVFPLPSSGGGFHTGGLETDSLPSLPPAPGGGGTNSGGGPNFTSPSYTTNDFWLEALSLGTNAYNSDPNSLTLILHGTFANIDYQILSTTNLQPTNTIWILEEDVIGSKMTNFTATTIPLGSGPEKFFKAFASTLDSDEDGLPDWWEQKYSTTSFPLSATNADTGNTGIADGYKQDSAGDGYNNLQKYQMGVPPGTWVTPQPPTGFTAVLNTNGTSATITWNPAPGPVQSYTILVDDDASNNGFVVLTNLSSSTKTFTDSASAFVHGIQYEIEANYTGGSSASSGENDPSFDPDLALNVNFVRGPQGRVKLLISAVPPNLQAVRVYVFSGFLQGQDFFNYWYNYPALYGFIANPPDYTFDIPIGDFTNGVYTFSDTQFPPYISADMEVRAIPKHGLMGPYCNDSSHSFVTQVPFLDGTTHLQENLSFLLQAATQVDPFNIFYYNSGSGIFPEFGCATNFAVAGFYGFADYDYGNYAVDEFKPFEDNSFYRNFILSTFSDLNANGFLNTGLFIATVPTGAPVAITNGSVTKYAFDTVSFVMAGETNPPPLALTNWQWALPTRFFPSQVYGYDFPPYASFDEIGLFYNDSASPAQFSFVGGTNLYGLNFTNVETAFANNSGVLTLSEIASGSPVSATSSNTYNFYPSVTPPTYSLAAQYFGRPSIDPLPSDSGFAVTNTTPPLLIYGMGSEFTLTAWAKERLSNGSSNAFGYLQWYFDKAFLADTNGNITTNQTGVLSEYGEFFPTQPGKIFLTTKTNALGQHATNAVRVIALCLDANHDGIMDTSLTGPDMTSVNRPFSFWANDDFDRWNNDDVDGTLVQDGLVAAYVPHTSQLQPDSEYRDTNGNRIIPCPRDLEDFARLWIVGVSNCLSTLPSGSTVTLSWQNNGGASIDIFQAADPDGGMAYLTNGATATNQINTNLCRYVGRLGPGGSIRLNDCSYSNCWAGDHYIFCGVAPGSDQLNLTVTDGNSNVLAQTSQYIQIQDIKQMYERWTLGDSPKLPPTTNSIPAEDNFSSGYAKLPFVYPPETDTNDTYILFVHGYNMEEWEKDRFAESAFKRLYWQHYHGRFGSVRWPTYQSPLLLYGSESQAWGSGMGLLNKLTELNSEYPGHVYVFAHSMGNVVTGQALLMAGTNRLVNTYVASQAAVSARAYDNTLPTDATNYYFSISPDSIGNYFTNNAPSYFHGNAGAGTFVNFFNPEDWALMGSTLFHPGWLFLQQLKLTSEQSTNVPTVNGSLEINYFYTTPSTNHPSGYYYQFATNTPIRNLLFTNDTFEIFAFCDQSYSLPLGAETNVAGSFQTLGQVNLSAPPYSFGSLHVGHSWQFRSDYPSTAAYWRQLLSTYNIQP